MTMSSMCSRTAYAIEKEKGIMARKLHSDSGTGHKPVMAPADMARFFHQRHSKKRGDICILELLNGSRVFFLLLNRHSCSITNAYIHAIKPTTVIFWVRIIGIWMTL